MSGPPGSQLVQKKGKRKNTHTSGGGATSSPNAPQPSNTANKARRADGATATSAAATAAKVVTNAPPVTSALFQPPRQDHVYVEAIPVHDLYDQLVRSDGCMAGASPSSDTRQRKQHNQKRRPFALQRDFSDLPYPRGMVNNSNFCFINSILQSLLFIPAFAQVAVSASCDAQARESCPTLAALGKWVLQYWKPGYTRLAVVAPQLMARPKVGASGAAPANGNGAGGAGVMMSLSPSASSQRALDGSVQEDAQEFLQKLLERLQVELVAFEDGAMRDSEVASAAHSDLNSTGASSGVEERSSAAASQKGWTMVKGKEKLAVREHVDAQGQSRLLSAIFGGTLESHLQGKQRQRDHVSVLVEKYFSLPIDIGFASECTMEQALEHTFTTERIYDSEREKNLKKTLRFGQLPSILLIQLRRWAMTREGDLVKLDNVVHLKRTLQIPRTICGSESLSNAERSYRLLSVVCHRGDAVGRGHYVTYLVHHAASPDVMKVQATGKANEAEAVRAAPPSASVILCNDTNISVVPASNMEKEAVYFLVYQRMV